MLLRSLKSASEGSSSPAIHFIGEEAVTRQKANSLATNIRTIIDAVAGADGSRKVEIRFEPSKTLHVVGAHDHITGDLLNAFWGMAAAAGLKLAFERGKR